MRGIETALKTADAALKNLKQQITALRGELAEFSYQIQPQTEEETA